MENTHPQGIYKFGMEAGLKATIKWIGIALGGLLGLLILSALALYGLGQMRLRKIYKIAGESVAIPVDAASLSEGKRIFQYRGCEACHGEQLQGLVYMDNPAIGQVITPNLTNGRGGIGGSLTDEDLIRAIRHGVRQDGTPLLFMPSTEFFYLSDGDLGKVLAYIHSMKPVDHAVPPSALSFTGFMVMNVTNAITFLPAELIPHAQPRPVVPEPGITPQYGAYLSLSCMVCHGAGMSGGEIPGFPTEWPAPPNLTSGPGGRLPAWGQAGFIELMRTGSKHGRAIGAGYMPWKSYRHMSDDELRAVYVDLMSLPPRDFGSR